MFCPKCGKENPDDARFCGNCGEDLSIIVEPPSINNTSAENKKEEEKSSFFKFFFSFGRKRKLVVTFGIIILVMLPVIIFISQENGTTAVEYTNTYPVENDPTGYGTRLEFNNAELFYTSNVTYQQAEKLGEYLIKANFFAGKTISSQFDKSSGVYVFKYVITPGYENDKEYLKIVSQMANQISENVFSGAPVEIYLTGSRFNALKVVNQNYKPQYDNTTNNDYSDNLNNYNLSEESYGKMLEFNNSRIYYTPSIERMDAQKIGMTLTEKGFFDGTKKVIQLSKDGNIFVFRQIVPKGLENDESVLNSAKSTADFLYKNVFRSRPFEVQLTDYRLKILNTVKSGF